jgi:hypothetical protein
MVSAGFKLGCDKNKKISKDRNNKKQQIPFTDMRK